VARKEGRKEGSHGMKRRRQRSVAVIANFLKRKRKRKRPLPMYIIHGPSSTLICIIYRKFQIFKKENSRNIKENKNKI
jgi:hypothetical protein